VLLVTWVNFLSNWLNTFSLLLPKFGKAGIQHLGVGVRAFSDLVVELVVKPLPMSNKMHFLDHIPPITLLFTALQALNTEFPGHTCPTCCCRFLLTRHCVSIAFVQDMRLLSIVSCLLAPSCLGVRAARCFVAQGVPLKRCASLGVTGPHTHAWESCHACVASRLPRAEQA
jgi:hypothetical protein